MKRIYYRGGMSPFETFSPGYILTHNVIGSNVGNFLYLNGVLRSIMVDEDAVIEPNYYNTNLYDPEYVNENFDCFVIPLADAFRENFVGELNTLTRFVRKLTIPCYVTGVGLKAPYEPDFTQPKPQDAAVKAFVKAVLDKSACIGVRGALTGKYLETLGFVEDRDFMVIGCPSMYSRGKRLHSRTPVLESGSKVCFNSNVAASVPNRKFIKLKMKEYENHYFVGQVVRELRSIYLGAPYEYKIEYNFHNVTEPIYRDGRLRFFCNVPKWIEFMKDADFTFGSRLHGTIAAVLADAPAVLVTKDSRTRELAEYHHLNAIHESELHKELTLKDIAEQQDFTQIEKYQKQNLDRFASFLKKNDIPNIYMDGQDPEETVFDRKIAQIQHLEGIVPISQCSLEEVAARNRDYYGCLDERMDDITGRLSEANAALKKVQAENEALRNQVQHRISLPKRVVRKVKKVLS